MAVTLPKAGQPPAHYGPVVGCSRVGMVKISLRNERLT